MDSVYALFVIGIILLLMEGKTIPAYFVYGIGILVKPQVLIFTPILLCGIWEHVFAKDFSLPNLLDLLTMAQTPFLGCGQLCRDLHGFRCHLQILNAVFNQRPWVFVLHWDLQIL